MYNLVIKQEAQQEIIEAYQYYESKLVGLGDKFENQLDEYFILITENPFLFEMKRKPYREAFIKKFPFIIVYEIIENDLIVYAVFNTSRNPTQKP